MRPITFNETKALNLYLELKNDSEIAEILGKSRNTIGEWRKRNKLPSISLGPRKDCSWQPGRNYRDVLTPSQAIQMSHFLKHLLWAGNKAVEAGVKPDVNEFINVYSGRIKSDEEIKEEARWKYREKYKAAQA